MRAHHTCWPESGDADGRPVVVNILAESVSADGRQQPGGAEAEACGALMESKPEAVPLVPSRIITLELGGEHKSTGVRWPGLYAAVCTQRAVSDIAGGDAAADALGCAGRGQAHGHSAGVDSREGIYAHGRQGG